MSSEESVAQSGLQYLDHSATTPVRREVLEAMWPYLAGTFGNPSSHHSLGEQATAALNQARRRVAAVLQVRPNDIVFTSGGTEANNLALKGIALAAQIRTGARHVVSTPIEHESILEVLDYLQRVHAFDVTLVPVDEFGRVRPDAVLAAVREDTALISVGYANNEVGTIQPLAEISQALAEAGRLIPLHTDAVQAGGWLPLQVPELGVSALSLAGHKLGAPKGCGVLMVRGRVPLEPLLHGGGQERERRSGTESVANAVAMATILELVTAEQAHTSATMSQLRDTFIEQLLERVPQARLTGPTHERLPNLASFTFAGTSGESVLLELERVGIICSSGSACAAGSDEPSHVLLAMGINPPVAQTSVRFSFGHPGGPAGTEPPASAAAITSLVERIGQAVERVSALGAPATAL